MVMVFHEPHAAATKQQGYRTPDVNLTHACHDRTNGRAAAIKIWNVRVMALQGLATARPSLLAASC